MRRSGFVVWAAAATACGRVGFGGVDPVVPDADLPDTGKTPLLVEAFDQTSLGAGWTVLRRPIDVVGGRAEVLDGPAKVGFNYGPGANGRGAILVAGAGDTRWTDYRFEADIEVRGHGTWNPVGLQACTERLAVNFRVQSYPESWNDPVGSTAYWFGIQASDCSPDVRGTVVFGSSHELYYRDPGCCAAGGGSLRTLIASTRSDAIVDGPNRYAVEVIGNRTQLFANGVLVFDYVDDSVPYQAPATPITYGGIAIVWDWETLGWIDNITVTPL